MTARNPTRARTAKQHPRASTRIPQPRRPERAISLRFELSELAAAVEGARQLAALVAEDRASSAEDHRAAPSACSAVCALVVQRLRMLDGVLAGDLDPRLALAPFNAIAAREVDDDVLLCVDWAKRR